jgi:NitT/TauT family transport system ATP-binding protein
MNDRAVCLDAASYSFGSLEIIKGLTLEIRRGELVAVVGPSGCGKTTLLNLMAGFYEPTAGKVIRPSDVRMVYQHDGLFPWLTAGENIEVGLRHLGDEQERKRRVKELLELMQLGDFSHYFPHQLSGGMRRRIELARVLAGNAGLLLLDEPFSALDYQTRLHIRNELMRILKLRPHTVVLVTHDIEEAAQLADRVLILSRRPATIRCELQMSGERPRGLTDPEVRNTMEVILKHLGPRPQIEPPAVSSLQNSGSAARSKVAAA